MDIIFKYDKKTENQHLFVTSPTQFQDLYEHSMFLRRCATNSAAKTSAFTQGGREINAATLQESYIKNNKTN